MKAIRTLGFSTSIFCALSASVAHAATGTWNGGAGNWNTTDVGWTGVTGTPWDSTNGATNSAIFGGTAGTVSLTSGVFANALTFNTTGYTISGANTLTLAGTTPTVTTGSGVTATISSIVAGTNGLTKEGAGTLTLSGLNTFTGVVNVNAGILTSATTSTVAGSFLGGAGTSGARRVVNIASGAKIQVDSAGGNSFLNHGAVLANGGYGSFYDINISGTLAIHDGTVGSNHQILQSTYNLSNGGIITKTTGSYSGGYAGLLFGFGGAGGGNINVTGTGNQITTSSIAFFNGAKITTNAGAELTISSQIGGGASSVGSNVIKDGAGTLIFTGNNNYTGTTAINAGTL
ncbi:MAG TPA: autotransporter-associated beta strand repeat-containing protein, partial [Luteolibacter sp.]